jgi:hypothetical protein
MMQLNPNGIAGWVRSDIAAVRIMRCHALFGVEIEVILTV